MNDEEFNEQLEEIKKKITTRFVAKKATQFVARHSVSFVAATLAKTYCPTENKKQKLQLTVGAYVIGGMAADKAVDWVGHEFDEAVDFAIKLVNKFKDSEEKPEELLVTKEPTE